AGAAAFFQNEVVLNLPGRAATVGERAGRGDKGGSHRARMLAVDAEVLPRMNAYSLAEGRHIDAAAKTPELLLGLALAESLGLTLGDKLELSRPRRAAPKVCIDGEMVAVERARARAPVGLNCEVVGLMAPEKLGRRARGQVVVVDLTWGQKIYSGARTNERFWVRPDPVVNIEDLQARLAGNFAYDVGRSLVIGQQADERAYRNGIYMAALLALMLGLYVIFHTLSMSLVERLREVGVLHALGARRLQVAGIFLLEAVVLSGAGGLLGLFGGLALARELQERGITTLGTGKHIAGFEVPVGVWPLVALGIGTALLGSIFPLLRARRASTVEALRGEKGLESSEVGRGFHLFASLLIAVLLPALYFLIVPVVGAASGALVGTVLLAVGVLGLLLAVPLIVPGLIASLCQLLARPLGYVFPFAGSMASHTMLSNPRRIAVSTAAIALVCAAFVGLKGMTASLRGEVGDWAKDALSHKVWVRDLPNVEFEALAAALHGQPEVLGVEPGSSRSFAPFLFIGLRPKELHAYGPLKGHPVLQNKFANERGLILSRRAANNLGYEVGDETPVRTSSGKVVSFQIIAISDEYGYFPHPDERLYGVVSDRYMQRFFCIDIEHPDAIGVRLKPGADVGVVEACVHEFLEGRGQPNFLLGTELRNLQVLDIRQDFRLFDLILALSALLAALGVLNGQLLSALERSGELGILRALGARRMQIAGMVWLESAIMGLFGGLLGVALGSLLAPIIVRALGSLSGLELVARGTDGWGWITVAAAVGITLAAGAYPVWRMNRSDAVEAIRTGA
ncbi:MAG: ABC transporter permease, partial [bacterium]